jgi:hypothetical protein
MKQQGQDKRRREGSFPLGDGQRGMVMGLSTRVVQYAQTPSLPLLSLPFSLFRAPGSEPPFFHIKTRATFVAVKVTMPYNCSRREAALESLDEVEKGIELFGSEVVFWPPSKSLSPYHANPNTLSVVPRDMRALFDLPTRNHALIQRAAALYNPTSSHHKVVADPFPAILFMPTVNLPHPDIHLSVSVGTVDDDQLYILSNHLSIPPLFLSTPSSKF